MTDFLGNLINLITPGREFTAITPNDSTDLTKPTRGILVGTEGNLRIHDLKGNAITLPNLAAGIIHPIQAKRVLATSTTASNIIGVN